MVLHLKKIELKNFSGQRTKNARNATTNLHHGKHDRHDTLATYCLNVVPVLI